MCSNWLGPIKFTLEKPDSDFWIINNYFYELLEDRGGPRELEKGKYSICLLWRRKGKTDGMTDQSAWFWFLERSCSKLLDKSFASVHINFRIDSSYCKSFFLILKRKTIPHKPKMPQTCLFAKPVQKNFFLYCRWPGGVQRYGSSQNTQVKHVFLTFMWQERETEAIFFNRKYAHKNIVIIYGKPLLKLTQENYCNWQGEAELRQ